LSSLQFDRCDPKTHFGHHSEIVGLHDLLG
jgi:hypothetical protein